MSLAKQLLLTRSPRDPSFCLISALPTMLYSVLLLTLTGLCAGCDAFRGSGSVSQSTAPEVVWSKPLQNDVVNDSQPLITDGIAYVPAGFHVTAYDVRTGEEIWRSLQIRTRDRISGKQILKDGDRLFLNDSRAVWCFAAKTGHLLWHTVIPNHRTVGGKSMVQTDTHLYLGGTRELVEIKKQTGTVTRRFAFGTDLAASTNHSVYNPVLGPAGRLYVPTGFYRDQATHTEGRLHALDPASGKVLWTYTVPTTYEPDGESEPTTSSPSVNNAAVFNPGISEDAIILPAGHLLIALDRRTGTPIWKRVYPKDGFDFTLAVHDGVAYVGSLLGFVYAIDTETGEQLWATRTRGSLATILTVDDGFVFFCNEGGGELWMLDAETGDVLWSAQPPGYKQNADLSYLSPLGVGEKYMVNVGSDKVYGLTRP